MKRVDITGGIMREKIIIVIITSLYLLVGICVIGFGIDFIKDEVTSRTVIMGISSGWIMIIAMWLTWVGLDDK